MPCSDRSDSEEDCRDCQKHGFHNIVFEDDLLEAVNIVMKMQKMGKQFSFLRHVQAGECSTIMNSEEECSKNMSAILRSEIFE